MFLSLVISQRIGGDRKLSKQSPQADQNSIETVFLIAICRQSGDKWQSKTLFLSNFDLGSLIVIAFLIAANPICIFICNNRNCLVLATHALLKHLPIACRVCFPSKLCMLDAGAC